MNECKASKSEIIENLKKDVKSKENKLEHLLDEKQKTNNENRLIELTNIIRITEQEIKFGKEDLENEKINDTKYKSMWNSLKHALKNGKWLDEDTIEGVLLSIDNIEYEAKFDCKEDLENEKINAEVVLGNIPASSMCCGRGDGCSRSTARS